MSVMGRLALILACLGAIACDGSPPIAPAPDRVPTARAAQQSDPWGYCAIFIVDVCQITSAEASKLCQDAYGDTFATPMECWHSNEAVLDHCVPLCGQEIICPGAETDTSALWCCNW